MRRMELLLAAALICLITAAGSPSQVVHQKGRLFSHDTITLARGESVLFLNDDTVPHNIMSTTTENAFDLGRWLLMACSPCGPPVD
jgi:hypothetical protein